MTHSEAAQQAPEQREALLSLGKALSALADKLRTRTVAGRNFAELSDGAAAIMSKAREMYTSRWAFQENAGMLASALKAFSDAASVVSAQASDEARATLAAVDMLASHAERIVKLGENAGPSASVATLKAELEPLETLLTGLSGRVKRESTLVDDAAQLSNRAGEIAKLAQSLRGNGRDAEAAALAISQAMTVFIRDITAVAERFASMSTELSDVAGRIAAKIRGQGESTPSTPPVRRDAGIAWGRTNRSQP